MCRFVRQAFPMGLVLGMVLAGCSGYECPLFPKSHEITETDRPPERPLVRPPMETPKPAVVYAPPAPSEPITPVLPPESPPAAQVPAAIVTAIEDLGQKYPGLFTFDSSRGLFRFNADITFDSGSSVVNPSAKGALARLAQILTDDQVKDRSMTIIGFTDSDRVVKPATITHLKSLGKAPTNQGLSAARAEAVAAILEVNGIDARRMTVWGRGPADPVADNRTPAGKAKNRRVEIYLSPMDGSDAQ